MFKDPLMKWPSGVFPYDALSEGAVTPESNMNQIMDASFELIERGGWTMEARLAWDQLRTVEKRLWVDFFLYSLSTEEILADLKGFGEERQLELMMTEFAQFFSPDPIELQLLIEELKPDR